MYLCNLYVRLGVRASGISVLFLSSNDGVGRGDCLFLNSSGNSRVQFVPTFPSTCKGGPFSAWMRYIVHHTGHGFCRSRGH
ncbi:hypothetical protein EDB85DRAFT_1951615, partial [Lactarius pseudohatsudake]